MDMVGHDHPRMQFVMSNFDPILNRIPNQLSNGRLSKERGAGAGLIQ